ncbi:hypothetical protein Asera_64010 [Actinocatenispora sera]|uniref:DUF2269 domain-containing protein n=1 Tax=Actinocatenispora sera TaxID=390989 RepID=A0A810LAJ1_9ACTN|nr:hypothetical protein [Actinocatenispora sera]BCJ32293.1 hypothetical protein Asera_64010 [Actinocatenispora sera]
MSGALRWRPAPSLRKTLLLVHIAAAGAWLGFDLMLGVLTIAMLTADPASAAAAAVSIRALVPWPLLIVGLLTLTTGILLGISSKYGLVRYRWVLMKLVLNVVLTTLVPLLLLPEATTIHDNGRAALESGAGPLAPWSALFPPTVSSTAVAAAIALIIDLELVDRHGATVRAHDLGAGGEAVAAAGSSLARPTRRDGRARDGGPSSAASPG